MPRNLRGLAEGRNAFNNRPYCLLEPLEPRLLLSAIPAGTTFDADGLPILHSLPGAPVTIYLDFHYQSRDGEKLYYDWDGDSSRFGTVEQEEIAMAWAKASSAYTPFDVDVTTEWPGEDQPFIWAAIYTTPTGPGSGGGARTFRYIPLSEYRTQRYSSTGGRVEDGLLAQSWIRQGAVDGGVIVHEVGHSHGVSGHESVDVDAVKVGIQNLPIERGPFTRSLGPIGGWYSFTSEWAYAANPAGMYWVMDDIAVITSAIVGGIKNYVDPAYDGDGFRADDHAGTFADATAMALNTNTWSADGVIERWADTDTFAFAWSGGDAWIGMQTAIPVPLLDGRFVVYDEGGTVVGAADPPGSLQASVRLENLPAGAYFIEVAGDGDYTELGAYNLTVSAASPQALEPLAHLTMDGNSLADSSGESHNGTWVGSAEWTTGRGGATAARFNGSNYIEVRSPSGNFVPEGLNPLGRTFSFWFKADNASGGTQYLFQDPTSPGYQIYLQDGRLKAYAINDAGLSNWRGGERLDSSVTLTSGQWYHATLTHRTTFSEVEGTLVLYLDGEEVARGAAGPVPSTTKFQIGSAGFAGAIDDVHIHADVVPEALIAEWAERTDLTGPAPTGPAIAVIATTTHDSARLDWPAVAGATGYTVFRSIDNQHYSPIATLPATATGYTDTGLQGSLDYFYRVTAIDAAGVGVADVQTRAPGVHYLAYTKVVKDAAPDYQWNNRNELWGHWSEGIHGNALYFFGPDGHRDTGLRIEHSTDGENFTELVTLPPNESVYYDTNLHHGHAYTYRVTPIDDLGPVDTAAVILQTTSSNANPTLVGDTLRIDQGGVGTIRVLDNDSDPDGDALTITAHFDGTYGTVTDLGGGVLRYEHTSGEVSADSFTYTVTDPYGGRSSTTVQVLFNVTSIGTFTGSWDIGNPNHAGWSAYVDGEYKIRAGGAEIGGTYDQFHFVSRPEAGDRELIARVDLIGMTDDMAAAGVMFRTSSAANAPFAMVSVRPDKQVVFQWRTASGAAAQSSGSPVGGTTHAKYIKITRQGNAFAGYYSLNGYTWTQIGTPQTVGMASNYMAGLAVTSHDSTRATTAWLTQVSFGGNGLPHAVADELAADMETPLVIDIADDLLANDTDDDGDPLSIVSFTQPSFGELLDNEDGTLTYTPRNGFVGDDSFTYTITDGNGGQGVGTVDIRVTDPPPTLTEVTVNTDPSQSVSYTDQRFLGIWSIRLRFSEPILFDPEDVTLQTVDFLGGVETLGEVVTPAAMAGTGTYTMLLGLPVGVVTNTWLKVTLTSGGITDSSLSGLDGDAPPAGSGRGYLFDPATDLPSGDGAPGGNAVFYVGHLSADVTDDGLVDDDDLSVILANWRTGTTLELGDVTYDGAVNDDDLSALLANWQGALASLPAGTPMQAGTPMRAMTVEPSLVEVVVPAPVTTSGKPEPATEDVLASGSSGAASASQILALVADETATDRTDNAPDEATLGTDLQAIVGDRVLPTLQAELAIDLLEDLTALPE